MDPKRMACVSFLARTIASRSTSLLRQFSVSAYRPVNENPPPPRASFLKRSMKSVLENRVGPTTYSSKDTLNTPPLALADSKLPRMGPSAGRSVIVQNDAAQALMHLRTILNTNRVRQDHNAQKFYETPSAKRKRLKRLRHRRRFKEGFKRMVALAMEMKRKGM